MSGLSVSLKRLRSLCDQLGFVPYFENQHLRLVLTIQSQSYHEPHPPEFLRVLMVIALVHFLFGGIIGKNSVFQYVLHHYHFPAESSTKITRTSFQ